MLVQALRALGAPVEYHVPNRLEEGYGLNSEALGQIARDGAAVVVTVDCGITSIAEAKEARRLGLELIILNLDKSSRARPIRSLGVIPISPGI